jgi:hypothetical protein
VAFLCLAQVTGLPDQLRAVVISTAPSTGSSGRLPFERAASLAVGCCRILLFLWLVGIFSGSRYITGTLPYSNSRTVSSTTCFHGLARLARRIFSRFWKRGEGLNTENSRHGCTVVVGSEVPGCHESPGLICNNRPGQSGFGKGQPYCLRRTGHARIVCQMNRALRPKQQREPTPAAAIQTNRAPPWDLVR